MNDEEAVRGHLDAANKLARMLNKPMLCYLIEMALLEIEDVDNRAHSDVVPESSRLLSSEYLKCGPRWRTWQ